MDLLQLTLTPEFGPAPYLAVLPYSQRPVADSECNLSTGWRSASATHSTPGVTRRRRRGRPVWQVFYEELCCGRAREGASLRTASGHSAVMYLLLITCVAALGGLLFGYDTAVISGAVGLLQQHFSLSATATGWAASSALAGCVLGAALAGRGCDQFGRHRTLVLAGICFLISALGTALAGGFTSVYLCTGSWAGSGSERPRWPALCTSANPLQRIAGGALVAVNQLAIVLGMLLIYIVNYRIHLSGTAAWNEAVGWRWMFASGVVPSVLLLGMLHRVPETARFLMMHGRKAEAERVAARTGAGTLEEIVEAEEQAAIAGDSQAPRAGGRAGAGSSAAGDGHQRFSLLRAVHLQQS